MKRKRSELPTSRLEGEEAIKQAQHQIWEAFREVKIETTSSSKKLRIVHFNTLNPTVTNMEELEVIDDSPNVIPTNVEEKEPSTPPSPSKTPSISSTSSPPKSSSVSLTQTPPPSPIEKKPNKSPTKKTPSPKEPMMIENPANYQNHSSKKTTTKGKTLSTSMPLNKSKKPCKNKFKLKEIVKLDFVHTDQLVELKTIVNQESTRWICQLSHQEHEAHQIWSQR